MKRPFFNALLWVLTALGFIALALIGYLCRPSPGLAFNKNLDYNFYTGILSVFFSALQLSNFLIAPVLPSKKNPGAAPQDPNVSTTPISVCLAVLILASLSMNVALTCQASAKSLADQQAAEKQGVTLVNTLTALENQAKTTQSALQTINDNLGQLKDGTEKFRVKVSQMNNAVTDLNSSFSLAIDQLKTLKSQNDSLKEGLDPIVSGYKELLDKREALKADLGGAREELAKLQAKIDGIKL